MYWRSMWNLNVRLHRFLSLLYRPKWPLFVRNALYLSSLTWLLFRYPKRKHIQYFNRKLSIEWLAAFRRWPFIDFLYYIIVLCAVCSKFVRSTYLDRCMQRNHNTKAAEKRSRQALNSPKMLAIKKTHKWCVWVGWNLRLPHECAAAYVAT